MELNHWLLLAESGPHALRPLGATVYEYSGLCIESAVLKRRHFRPLDFVCGVLGV